MRFQLFKSFGQHIRRLKSSREGSVLPIFAICAVFLIVIIGASVDISRTVNAREKLSYALDAAALSVAADLSTSVMSDDEIKAALEDSFRANLADAHFLDEAIDNLDYTVDPENGLVTVTSNATIDNYFLDMGNLIDDDLGPESFVFGTSSQVTYSKFDVELTLVVDVTGSMSGEIEDLKDAAEAVVNILIPDDSKDGKVKISIVPYSVGVNLGDYAETATKKYSSRCATERTGKQQYTDASYSKTAIGDGSGTYRTQDCSDSEILPLTDDRSKLLKAIGDLETDGYTAGHTGIGWGWYTLSPNWSDLWPSGSVGAAYTDEDVLKFALIMTDGDFNTHYEKVKMTYTECEKLKDDGEYTGTCKAKKSGKKRNYWLERSEWGYDGESSVRARSLCDAMRDEDIEMFGVYFGTNGNSNGAKVMKACADTGNYYQASSSSDLIQAFANIAKKIQQIYISR